jgi:hypothetical protein
MIIRKHATRQHNLPNTAKTSNWSTISKVPKLFEQTHLWQDRRTGICPLKLSLNVYI